MMASVTILCVNSDGSQYSKTVEAKLVGALAVHLTPKVSTDDGKPVFSVTHVATGLKLPLCYETSEAAEAVAHVLQKLPVDWSGKQIVSAEVAEAYAEVLQKLPVDWYSRTVTDDYRRPHLIPALTSIAALFGGFLVETPIDQPPAGSA